MLSVVKAIDPATPPVDPVAARGLLDPQNRPGDDITPRFPVLTINLKGESLDPKGSIKVDGQSVRSGMFWITPEEPQDATSGFSEELNVSLNNPDTGISPYVEGTHTLTLVNNDGQAAESEFPTDPMILDPVPDLTGGQAAVPITVTGKNFVTGMSVEWKNPSNAAPEPDAAITDVSPTKLTVRLKPGPSGAGELTLISPIGLKASSSAAIK